MELSKMWSEAFMELFMTLDNRIHLVINEDSIYRIFKNAWSSFLKNSFFYGRIVEPGHNLCCGYTFEKSEHCVALIPMTLKTINKIHKSAGYKYRNLYNFMENLATRYEKVFITIVDEREDLLNILNNDPLNCFMATNDLDLCIGLKALRTPSSHIRHTIVIDTRKIERLLLFSFFVPTLSLSSTLDLLNILKDPNVLGRVIDSIAILTSLFVSRYILYYYKFKVHLFIGENRISRCDKAKKYCIKVIPQIEAGGKQYAKRV